MRSLSSSVLGALVTVLAAAPAFAQQPLPETPLPAFVVDARGVFAGLGHDATTAGELTLTPDQLPGRGLGGVIDVTFFPLRGHGKALGIGGEGLLAFGSGQPLDSKGLPFGPVLHRRVQNLSGQISLNFGHRDGWSYLTGGLGPLQFLTYGGDTAPADPPAITMTQNFGGGARWFVKRRLAFNLDVRFYLTRPANSTVTSAGRARQRVLVLSAGISIR
jgi:hypothetical protein